MSLSAGLIGVIPAMEKLLTPAEQGPVRLSTASLILWSLGLAFFGVIFSVPIRKQVIIREKLRFPSGTATATMIKILHASGRASLQTNESLDVDRPAGTPADDWHSQAKLLATAFGVSSVFVGAVVQYHVDRISEV